MSKEIISFVENGGVNMNTVISIILMTLVISYDFYNLFRKKYEVFGIIIDKNREATDVDIKHFRTYKNAIKCCKEYENKYFGVCMNEI